MYTAMLVVHSWLRWAVVIFALLAVGRAFAGWLGRREWTGLDQRLGLLYMVTMDVQILVGLILYGFLSPTTTAAFQDFGAAMGDTGLRYFAVEHIALMLVALALVHIGRSRSRRTTTPQAGHRNAAIFYGLALLLIVLAIPWPFSQIARPLFRLG